VLSLVNNPAMHNAALSQLAERGFVEGRNLVVDIRVGTAEQMPALARELVAAGPDVIMAVSDWAVYPARGATKSIPIVASPMGADPVVVGVAESWARPGGNVTGVTLIAPELEVKRLGLLREVAPSARRIAILSMHREVTEPGEGPIRETASRLGIQLVELYIDRPDEFDQAFAAMRSAGAEALVIVPVPELSDHAETGLRSAMSGARTRARVSHGGFRRPKRCHLSRVTFFPRPDPGARPTRSRAAPRCAGRRARQAV
jgi:putative ABC transport system substrate-binding protein